MKDFGVELMSAIHKADIELQKMRVDGTLWTFDLNTIPDNTTVDDKSQGMGAYLTSLRRTRVGSYIADQSLKPEDFAQWLEGIEIEIPDITGGKTNKN